MAGDWWGKKIFQCLPGIPWVGKHIRPGRDRTSIVKLFPWPFCRSRGQGHKNISANRNLVRRHCHTEKPVWKYSQCLRALKAHQPAPPLWEGCCSSALKTDDRFDLIKVGICLVLQAGVFLQMFIPEFLFFLSPIGTCKPFVVETP